MIIGCTLPTSGDAVTCCLWVIKFVHVVVIIPIRFIEWFVSIYCNMVRSYIMVRILVISINFRLNFIDLLLYIRSLLDPHKKYKKHTKYVEFSHHFISGGLNVVAQVVRVECLFLFELDIVYINLHLSDLIIDLIHLVRGRKI